MALDCAAASAPKGELAMFKAASITALLALLLALTTSRLNFVQAGDKKADAATPSPTAQNVELPKADRDGWISLFNGKELTGWYGDPKIWRVENGYISGKAAKASHNSFLIYNHPIADFELTSKCMLIKGGGFTNSGIQYRSKVIDPKEWIVGGYQADMGEGYWGTLYEERGRGGLGKKLDGAKDPKDGEWADFRIVANGNHLEHYLNGVKSMDLVDTDEKKAAKDGIIALQYHAPGLDFEVRFKDVRIKILGSTSQK
jgi:Domain of Unknown Function (DUF1080)